MIKPLLRRIADVLIVLPVRYIRSRSSIGPQLVATRLDVLSTLHNNAVIDSANYAESHMPSAMAFQDKEAMWTYVLGLCKVDGLYCEFGVWEGNSINYFARLLNGREIYGFDSFVGLKDDWPAYGWAKGHFSVGGNVPIVEPNVTLIKGFFDETLPSFLVTHPGPLSFVHIDCDTYNSTRTVLNLILDQLRVGSVILFDEYFGCRGWRHEEWKAWQEFVKSNHIKYEYKAYSIMQVAVQISELPS
jgi:Methyltransferase domain